VPVRKKKRLAGRTGEACILRNQAYWLVTSCAHVTGPRVGVMVRRRMMVQAEHSAHRVRYDPSSCQTVRPRSADRDGWGGPAGHHRLGHQVRVARSGGRNPHEWCTAGCKSFHAV